jgi:hypothetical protein
MPLKPYRVISEFDVVNHYKFVSAAGTGDAGVPVSISVGFNGQNGGPVVVSNLAAGLNNGNTYSPRWGVTPAVTGTTSGQIPFGITLYKTQEVNQFGYSYLYDKQRKDEAEAVVSGEAVPIATKGTLSVYVGTGASPQPSPTAARFAIVNGVGSYGAQTHPTGAFGEWQGGVDADGYAVLKFDCTAARLIG